MASMSSCASFEWYSLRIRRERVEYERRRAREAILFVMSGRRRLLRQTWTVACSAVDLSLFGRHCLLHVASPFKYQISFE